MNDTELNQYLADLIDKAIENAKKEGKIGSYSRITYNEIGRPLVEGIEIAINDSKNGTIKAFNKLLKALQYQRDFMLIDEAEYYRQLESLRNNYLIKGSSDWWKYTAQIIEYEQTLTLNQQQEEVLRQNLTDEALKAKKKYLDDLVKAQAQYANKLKAYGDDFFAVREVTTNFDTRAVEAKATLTNYQAHTNRLKKYQAEMDKLKERGIVPQDLMGEIADMNIDQAMEYVALLNRTPDDQLKEYIANRAEYIRLCDEVASDITTEAVSSEVLETFTTSLEEIFAKAGLVLPDNFYQLGSDGADDFGEGFMGGLKIIEDELTDSFTEGFKSSLENAAQTICDLYSHFTFITGESLGGKVINNVKNSFNIGTEKESSAQQIKNWQDAQTLERMRTV